MKCVVLYALVWVEDLSLVNWFVPGRMDSPATCSGEMCCALCSGVGGRFVPGELVCSWKNGQSCNMRW